MKYLIDRLRWEWWPWRSAWNLPKLGECDIDTFNICLDRMLKSEPVNGKPRR